MVKQNVGGEPIQRIHRPIKSQKTSVAIREKVASNRLSYQRHTTHHNYHTSPPQNVKVYNQKSNIRCQATLELRKKYFLYYLQIVKTFTKNITLSPLIYIPYTYNKCQDILLPFKLNHEKYTTIQRLLYNNYNQSKYFDIYLQTQPTPTFKFSRQREVSKNYSPDKPRKKLTLPSNPRGSPHHTAHPNDHTNECIFNINGNKYDQHTDTTPYLLPQFLPPVHRTQYLIHLLTTHSKHTTHTQPITQRDIDLPFREQRTHIDSYLYSTIIPTYQPQSPTSPKPTPRAKLHGNTHGNTHYKEMKARQDKPILYSVTPTNNV